MSDDRESSEAGWVVSDLHLFARRSNGLERMRQLRPRLLQARHLVLNGDIFDFRWSTLAGHAATVQEALKWLEQCASELPGCQIHYLLGNHDCLDEFVAQLDAVAARWSGFQWRRHTLQLGDALFLHGDCATVRMDASAFARYRSGWMQDQQRHGIRTRLYEMSDLIGGTRLAHRWQFPRKATLERLTYHLDQTLDGWRRSVKRCYFGHTHEPFSAVTHEGITFHNTGSAIVGMGFNPTSFSVTHSQ